MTIGLTVAVIDGEPRVDSRLIAEQLGVEHKSTRELVLKYQTDFEEFGKVPFETEASGKTNQPQKFALLNEDQSYLLLTYTQNTQPARELKKRLVQAFAECRRRLNNPAQPLEQTPPQTPSRKLSATERELLMVAREAYKTARLFGFEGNMAALSADNYVRNTLGRSVLEPMGATHLLADPRGRTYTPSELGKLLVSPVSAIKFNLLLESAGLQTKEFGAWMPTDAASGLFEWLDTGKRHSNGVPVKQIKWFQTVLDRLPASPQKEAA